MPDPLGDEPHPVRDHEDARGTPHRCRRCNVISDTHGHEIQTLPGFQDFEYDHTAGRAVHEQRSPRLLSAGSGRRTASPMFLNDVLIVEATAAEMLSLCV